MININSLPILKQVWGAIRFRKIVRKHDEVASHWRPIISRYFKGEISHYRFIKKVDFKGKNVIWQYWGQGTGGADVPEVVQLCFASVDQFRGDYVVIRLDDQNISDYLDLPEFVVTKQMNGTFTKTFFSDLLRLMLLDTYGGVWLDATVLLTDYLNADYAAMDYFVYSRDFGVEDKKFWMQSYAFYWNWSKDFRVNMLSSIFYAQENNKVVSTLMNLLLNYWKHEGKLIDYFVFQILYDELIRGALKNSSCVVVDDTYPHLLQTKFNGSLKHMTVEDILSRTGTHKMSYFDQKGMRLMREFLGNKN